MAWSRYGRGTVMVRLRFGHGMVAVRSLGTLLIRSWYGTLKVCSRLLFSPRCTSNLVRALYDLLFAVPSRCGQVLSGYAPSSLVVRYTQGSFPPGILDERRTWYTYCTFYCSRSAITA